MVADDTNHGWRDQIGTFMRLQAAVKILARGKGNFKERMNEATLPLVELSPEHFPVCIRRRAAFVLGARSRVRQVYYRSKLVSFEFGRLSPKEREELTESIVSLYEACIHDMTKPERNIVYPIDR